MYNITKDDHISQFQRENYLYLEHSIPKFFCSADMLGVELQNFTNANKYSLNYMFLCNIHFFNKHIFSLPFNCYIYFFYNLIKCYKIKGKIIPYHNKKNWHLNSFCTRQVHVYMHIDKLYEEKMDFLNNERTILCDF